MEINAQRFKTAVRKAYDGIKDGSLVRDLKELKNEIKEATEVGKVFSEGVQERGAYNTLYKSRECLENWAKANNINIIFHTPQAGEAGAASFEKPLGVTVYRTSLLDANESYRVIDGDIAHTSTHKTDKLTAEDNFTRRVYRNVEEMTKEIKDESAWADVKKEIKTSNEMIKTSIKDFFSSFIPKKK